MPSRLPVTKTPKVYVGGQFIRSESGRVFPVREGGNKNGSGALLGNIPQCTRKDLRNAVEAAAKAGADWAKRTPYNRGQIIYRLGEMLEARSGEMADAIVLSGAGTKAAATKEVAASVDRLIYYAGWADKYEQVLGNTNPVAGPFFNFTVAEPMGIVGIIADDEAPLLGLISQIAPVIVSGNSCVALASEQYPYPAIVLGEMLATSDLPGGVVNLLTGFRKEMLPTFATHTHIRGISAVVNNSEKKELQLGAADSIKRVRAKVSGGDVDWMADRAQGAYEIRDFIEFKTTWHPIGA
ncbi:MAG: aldehyde dehydrogenase family protein [Gemmatimonadaceae bacterium]|nr:aldehyde dehydrogenase family protein [Gemmatimonadaceae bacterium]